MARSRLAAPEHLESEPPASRWRFDTVASEPFQARRQASPDALLAQPWTFAR